MRIGNLALDLGLGYAAVWGLTGLGGAIVTWVSRPKKPKKVFDGTRPAPTERYTGRVRTVHRWGRLRLEREVEGPKSKRRWVEDVS